MCMSRARGRRQKPRHRKHTPGCCMHTGLHNEAIHECATEHCVPQAPVFLLFPHPRPCPHSLRPTHPPIPRVPLRSNSCDRRTAIWKLFDTANSRAERSESVMLACSLGRRTDAGVAAAAAVISPAPSSSRLYPCRSRSFTGPFTSAVPPCSPLLWVGVTRRLGKPGMSVGRAGVGFVLMLMPSCGCCVLQRETHRCLSVSRCCVLRRLTVWVVVLGLMP